MQQQPLSASFERITQASVLYDAWSDTQNQMITEAEQWGVHAVQSVAWNMLGTQSKIWCNPGLTRSRNPGNNQLADVEDTIVTALTEAGSPDNTRLSSNLNRAYRVSPCLRAHE